MRIQIRANALHSVCKQLGDISRDNLARQMGVASTTAFRVDSGLSDPSPKFIAALITISGRSFDDLFEIVGQDAA